MPTADFCCEQKFVRYTKLIVMPLDCYHQYLLFCYTGGCLLALISPRGKITAKQRQDTYQGGDNELNFGVFGYETALYRPLFGVDIPYSHGNPPSFEIVVFACPALRY
jgi:hypothetical protein